MDTLMIASPERARRVGARRKGPQPRTLFVGIGVACFVYILLRPVSSNYILVPVLAAWGAVAGLGVFVGRRRLAPRLWTIWYVQVAYGVVFASVGAILGAPGVLSEMLVYLAAPLLFWTILLSMDERALRLAFFWLAIATCVLSAGILFYVGGQRGLIPTVIPHGLLDQFGAGIGQTEFGTPQIRLYSLSTLAAAAPFWMASLLVPRDRLMPSAKLRVTAAVLAALAALVGGRLALVIVLALTPVLVWLTSHLVGRQHDDRRHSLLGRTRLPFIAAVLAVLVAGVAAPSVLSLKAVTGSFGAVEALIGVGGSASVDTSVLRQESDHLLAAWGDSPLVGNGLGAVIPGYRRSDAAPWDFELQYQLLLFQSGLVGAAMFGGVLYLVLRALRSAAREQPQLASSLIVATTAAVALLLANTTDPYLQAPGNMWGIYVPLAVANVMLLSPKDATSPRQGRASL
jgi:hypothetical protein